MKKTILFAALFIFVIGSALLVHGQTNETLSVRLDPDDWNQVIYTRDIDKDDSLVALYWVKRNKDQFARIAWQRQTKISPNLSVVYGAGGQALSNQAGFDPQAYGVTGVKAAAGRVSATNLANFNISFRRPLIVKNLTVVQVKAGKDFSVGVRGENGFNSKGKFVEARNGMTGDYSLRKTLTLGGWVYRNFRTHSWGVTAVVTCKF